VEGKHSFLLSVLFIIGIIINLYLIGSMLIGIILLLLYFLTVGKKIGDIFLEDRVPLKFLVGIFLFLGWLIISEGAILYLGQLKMPWILIPALAPPFILQSLKRRKKQIKADFPISVKQNAQILTKKNILLFAGFAILWVLSFFILLASRTGAMIFSVWEVLPFYFAILLAGLVMLCVLVSHSLVQNKNGHKISLLLVFLIAFLIFFIPVIVYEYSFDPDVWTHLAFLKTIDSFGSTYLPQTQGAELHKVGLLALITTISKLVVVNPSFDFLRGVTWLISPILAVIFIPLFTHYILLRIYPSGEKPLLVVGSLAFTFFPLFWYAGISINASVAQIFFFSVIFFGIRALRKGGEIKLLIPLIFSAVATLLVELILGFYALAFVLLVILFWSKWSSNKFLIYVLMFIVTVSVPLTMVNAKAYLQPFLPTSLKTSEYDFYFSTFNVGEKAANFLLPPLYDNENWLANSLVGGYFNWVRYFILLGSIYIFRKQKQAFDNSGEQHRIRNVLLVTAICFFSSWFLVTTFVAPEFALGGYRFAYPVDVVLTFLAGVVLYSAYKKIHGDLAKIGHKSQIYRFGSLILLLLVVSGSLIPISVGFLSPNFPKDGLAVELGRPTWRAVSSEEIAAIDFIRTSVGESRYVVVSDYFLAKVAAGILGIRYAPTPNFNTGNQFKEYFTQMSLNPSIKIMSDAMKDTDSKVAYFVTNDYWIKQLNVSTEKIELMKSLATEYRVFGNEYKIYVFKYETI
jgi:hypothetical protein